MSKSEHTPTKAETYLIFAFCLITAVIPLFSINIPRSFAFVPGVSGLLFFTLYYCLSGEKPKISIKAVILVSIILGMSTLSLIWADYFNDSKNKVIKLLALLPLQVFLISLAASLKKEHLKPLVKFLPIGFIAASLILIFEIFTKGTLHNLIRGEDISAIVDPDDFNRGSVALSLYAFCAFALMRTHLKTQTAAVLVFVPVIAAVLLSESLAAQIAIPVGLLFLFAFPYHSKTAHRVLKFVIIALMISAPFLVTPLYENFAQGLQENPILASAYVGQRLEIWDYVARYALENPLLGYGISATGEIKDFDTLSLFTEDNTILHPHNFALQIWIEFGLIGIIIASALMYYLLTEIEKNSSIQQQKVILPTLMAALIPAAVSYGLWQGLWLGLLFHVAAVSIMTKKLV